VVHPPGIYPAEDPWLLCDSPLDANNAYNLFDRNKDMFVDRVEFIDALATIPYCCGGNCPFASWCDPISWKLFPATTSADDASFAGRAGILTNAAFLRHVKEYNYTGFVPNCRRRLSVIQPAPLSVENEPSAPRPLRPAAQERPVAEKATAARAAGRARGGDSGGGGDYGGGLEKGSHVEVAVALPPPPPPTPPPALWQALDAPGGQIHLSIRARNSSWARKPGATTAWPPLWPREVAQYYAPADRPLEIRMLPSDAKVLQTQVGPLYGDLSSLGQGYVVFDVPAAPGVPRSLWVYATAPVYHILQPALLAHLSLGTLVPTLLRFRVRFHNTVCDSNLTLGEVVRAPCSSVYMVADPTSR
jgi:hypothetical protein